MFEENNDFRRLPFGCFVVGPTGPTGPSGGPTGATGPTGPTGATVPMTLSTHI